MIPIVHSVIDSVAFGQEIKKRWGFSEPFRCELLTRGMNDVYLIQVHNKCYAARVWRADKQTAETVLWELQFLQHLKKNGIPVIAAVPDRDGQLYFSLQAPEGHRQVCLFEWAYGRPFFANPQPELAYRIGTKVADMHLAGKDFSGETARLIDFPGEIRRKWPYLAARLGDRPDDRKFFERVAESIASKLEEVYSRGVPFGPIHGDVHTKNIFVTTDDSFVFLDFDTCGQAHLLHDVMSLAWANTYHIEWKHLFNTSCNGGIHEWL